jgi:hypothetical protein
LIDTVLEQHTELFEIVRGDIIGIQEEALAIVSAALSAAGV